MTTAGLVNAPDFAGTDTRKSHPPWASTRFWLHSLVWYGILRAPSTFCTRTRQIDDSDSGRPITINPHDRFFRHALVKPDISRGFFQRYLSSEVVDRLDLDT